MRTNPVSILSASLGLTRYRIIEEIPGELLQQVPEQLAQNSFVDIDNTAEERSFGWTNIDDFLDVNWAVSPPEKAEYFAFSMRLETRRVQPAVLRKHYQIALKAELERNKEQGKTFVSRDRKRELKEQVTLKLRARSLPVPAVFDVVWAPSVNRVYLDTTNAKARSLFEDLFIQTFDMHLEQLAPFYMAMEMLGEESVEKLENLDPTIFV